MSRPEPRSVRVYRALLRLYDPAFRVRHEGEMVRLFREKEADARASGHRSAFLAGALLDVLRNGLGSRIEAGRRRSPGPDHHGRGEGRGGMDALLRDVRYAVRSLLKSPGFTVMAVVTIALGIGANTAIFSVVRAVLLQPLPYDEPEELVVLWGELRARGVTHFPMSPPDFKTFQDEASRLDDLAAVFAFEMSLTGDGDPVQIEVAAVTWNFFDLLGVEPFVGRSFSPEDDLPNPPGADGQNAVPVAAMLSHGLWERRYGAAPDILGRTIDLSGNQAEIVGVLPEGFEALLPAMQQVPTQPDVWVTARADYVNAPANNVFLRPVGRLAPGATVEQAREEIARIAAELTALSESKESADWYVRVDPLAADLTAHVRPTLLALFGAVVFVLLIACANVGNLLLVRAQARGRELAVHAALGGTRGRIARQLLVESGVLALAGAGLGVLFARGGIEILLALGPEDLPRLDTVALDGTVLAFTLLCAAGAAFVFGLIPSLRAARVDLAEVLKSGGRGSSARGGQRMRSAVVVTEVALSVVLLIGAGLMVRSFVALARVDPGFQAEGVLAFEAAFPFGRYPTNGEREAAFEQLEARLEAIPGVTSSSAGFPLPLESNAFNGRYGPEEALSDPSAFGQADYRVVRPGYFETLGTRVVEGRTFSQADHADSAAVVVVDEVLARTLWPTESAVGKRFLVRPLTQEPEFVEIIGVVEHQRAHTLAADGPETIFFSDRFMGSFSNSWVIRSDVDPLALVDEVRTALAAVDPSVPLADLRPLADDVSAAMSQTRFALTLIGIFGVLALVLASVGLYGVLAYSVRQRTREIGIRVAFGAERGTIWSMVLKQGLGLVLLGAGLGVVGALAVTRTLESILVGVTPTDPLTFVGITGLFVMVALAACGVPARRATRVDPMIALREE